MKEYIINALDANRFVGEAFWNGFQLLLIYSPIYILCIVLLIMRYKKGKAKNENMDLGDMFNGKYFIILLIAIVYTAFLLFDLLAVGNSIIIYELNK